MKRKGISQEELKLIACITMLIDHVGAVFFPGSFLRVIGRVSFPIYCYLLTEGAVHTGNRRRYGRRLLIGVFLAEIPFDLLFFGGCYWGKQNVMLTLLIGYLYCMAALHTPKPVLKVLLMLPFAYLGEVLNVDYGAWGIVMIGMFLLTKGQFGERLQQSIWLLALTRMMSKATILIGPARLLLQPFSVAAMVPICAYDGRKRTKNIWIQRGFYLFYPVHLLVLFLLKRI